MYTGQLLQLNLMLKDNLELLINNKRMAKNYQFSKGFS